MCVFKKTKQKTNNKPKKGDLTRKKRFKVHSVHKMNINCHFFSSVGVVVEIINVKFN